MLDTTRRPQTAKGTEKHSWLTCGCQLLLVKGSTPFRVEAGPLKDDAEDH